MNTSLAGFEVDFLWPESMLVVEIDGGGHDRPPARRKDDLEDRVLRGAGYTVLRFTERTSPSGPRTCSHTSAGRGIHYAAARTSPSR